MKIESVQVRNLCMRYHPQDSSLFEGFNVDLKAQKKYLILTGPQGCGRSTLLKILAGLNDPTSGQVTLNHRIDFSELTFEEAIPWRLKIGYGFDYGGLLHNRTLIDNLTLPLIYHSKRVDYGTELPLQELMQRFSIAQWSGKRPSEAPGTARKIVCLLRSLIFRPDLLLLDDPNLGISKELFLDFMKLVQEMRAQFQACGLVILVADPLELPLNPDEYEVQEVFSRGLRPAAEVKNLELERRGA